VTLGRNKNNLVHADDDDDDDDVLMMLWLAMVMKAIMMITMVMMMMTMTIPNTHRLGDEDGVLELSRPGTVPRHRRPLVRPRVALPHPEPISGCNSDLMWTMIGNRFIHSLDPSVTRGTPMSLGVHPSRLSALPASCRG
jgi:hypothetical protein